MRLVCVAARGLGSCAAPPRRFWRNRREEVAAKCEARGVELLISSEEWARAIVSGRSSLALRCETCDTVVRSTSVVNFMARETVGCKCTSTALAAWSKRRAEVLAKCEVWGVELLVSEDEWPRAVTNQRSYVKMRCLLCRATVSSTSVGAFMDSEKLGCACKGSASFRTRCKSIWRAVANQIMDPT